VQHYSNTIGCKFVQDSGDGITKILPELCYKQRSACPVKLEGSNSKSAQEGSQFSIREKAIIETP
jgi:hypothetical protein